MLMFLSLWSFKCKVCDEAGSVLQTYLGRPDDKNKLTQILLSSDNEVQNNGGKKLMFDRMSQSEKRVNIIH